MKVICAYCGKVLGHKEPYENHEYTHGMCKSCHDLFLEGFFDDDPKRLLIQKGQLPDGST